MTHFVFLLMYLNISKPNNGNIEYDLSKEAVYSKEIDCLRRKQELDSEPKTGNTIYVTYCRKQELK